MHTHWSPVNGVKLLGIHSVDHRPRPQQLIYPKNGCRQACRAAADLQALCMVSNYGYVSFKLSNAGRERTNDTRRQPLSTILFQLCLGQGIEPSLDLKEVRYSFSVSCLAGFCFCLFLVRIVRGRTQSSRKKGSGLRKLATPSKAPHTRMRTRSGRVLEKVDFQFQEEHAPSPLKTSTKQGGARHTR